MIPMLIGALASAAPAIIDQLSGASAAKKKAQDQQLASMQSMLNGYNQDIGSSATDSASFKASQALNDKGYAKQTLANTQNAAASGATSEAKLGAMSSLNDSYNTSQLNAMQIADQERRRLMAQRNALMMQLGQARLGQAQEGLNQQNQLTSGLAQMAPYLMPSQNPIIPTGVK